MAKNIVLLSDGTGDSFESHTNVREMAECLAVYDDANQVVIYDRGVGTPEKDSKEFLTYCEQLGNPKNLISLSPGDSQPGPVEALLHHVLGEAIGMGLDENVRQLYSALARCYEPGDCVFLFGFSRGAFTVRALAGLLYRCLLSPPLEEEELKARFDKGWKLFLPLERPKEVEEFRQGQIECPVHFLGLWDTVKSYGILDPVMLPHLRHNPIVKHVRHALAIHEHRAFFQHTTWGLLDLDEQGAMRRLCRSLNEEDLDLLEEQRANIKEVWFDGYHSDIGGGSGPESGKITQRWMLGEAVNIPDPVRLSEKGESVLAEPDCPTPVSPLHESRKAFYVAAEQMYRYEIDNSGESPTKHLVHGGTGVRDLAKSRRYGKVFLHESVRSEIEMKSERCQTLTTASTAGPAPRG